MALAPVLGLQASQASQASLGALVTELDGLRGEVANLWAALAERDAALAARDAMMVRLSARLDAQDAADAASPYSSSASSLASSSSSSSPAEWEAESVNAGRTLLSASQCASAPTKLNMCSVSSSSITAGDLNVTGSLYISGTLYWHGREWGPGEPTTVPTPTPSPAPFPAPSPVPVHVPVASANTPTMPVSSYDPTPGGSVCQAGCFQGTIGPRGSDMDVSRSTSGFGMHTGHAGNFPSCVKCIAVFKAACAAQAPKHDNGTVLTKN